MNTTKLVDSIQAAIDEATAIKKTLVPLSLRRTPDVTAHKAIDAIISALMDARQAAILADASQDICHTEDVDG